MSDVLRKEMIEKLHAIKSGLIERGDFVENKLARSCYVITLTWEGALMFSDELEFAGVCVDFCKRKEREAILGN